MDVSCRGSQQGRHDSGLANLDRIVCGFLIFVAHHLSLLPPFLSSGFDLVIGFRLEAPLELANRRALVCAGVVCGCDDPDQLYFSDLPLLKD